MPLLTGDLPSLRIEALDPTGDLPSSRIEALDLTGDLPSSRIWAPVVAGDLPSSSAVALAAAGDLPSKKPARRFWPVTCHPEGGSENMDRLPVSPKAPVAERGR